MTPLRGALSSGVRPQVMRFLLILLVLLGAAASVHAECAKFEPVITSLVGKLTTREYPGPPNYESTAAGDTAERQWILVLKTSLCVHGDASFALNADAVSGVGEVQLVAAGSAKELASQSGKEVEVSGALFAAHTGHHRTPVLLTVHSVRPNNSLERSHER